jgi:hypothetical protein
LGDEKPSPNRDIESASRGAASPAGSGGDALHNSDPLHGLRSRIRRSFWLMSLQPLEPGELLTPDHHLAILERLPEDGMTLFALDARGRLTLLVSIAEEQLAEFAERDWEIVWRTGPEGIRILGLLFGTEEVVECPFEFDLNDEQPLQAALRLADQPELPIYAFTHVEDGLMLTLSGDLETSEEFREAVQEDLIGLLTERESHQSHGST